MWPESWKKTPYCEADQYDQSENFDHIVKTVKQNVYEFKIIKNKINNVSITHYDHKKQPNIVWVVTVLKQKNILKVQHGSIERIACHRSTNQKKKTKKSSIFSLDITTSPV